LTTGQPNSSTGNLWQRSFIANTAIHINVRNFGQRLKAVVLLTIVTAIFTCAAAHRDFAHNAHLAHGFADGHGGRRGREYEGWAVCWPKLQVKTVYHIVGKVLWRGGKVKQSFATSGSSWQCDGAIILQKCVYFFTGFNVYTNQNADCYPEPMIPVKMHFDGHIHRLKQVEFTPSLSHRHTLFILIRKTSCFVVQSFLTLL